MPSDYESIRETWEGAIACYRSAMIAFYRSAMEAQSERVGPYFSGSTEAPNYRFDLRPVRMADIDYRYPNRIERQPERPPQAERRGQMTFSTKQPPLTPAEKGAIREFFKKCLKDGYAAYPLSNRRIPIYWDGEYKFIHTNRMWTASGDYFYIGYGEDNGDDIFGSPANRLAFVVALMSACDMAGDAELKPLVEERLSKILAGVYASAVAPLAERSNKEPVSRIAWSAAGGVAAFVDGEWVTPVTGEPVEVGEGWVVVETGEGTMPTTPPVAASSETDYADIERRFREWAENYGVSSIEDGRIAVPFGGSREATLERIALRPNLIGCVVELNTSGNWAITYPLTPAASSTEPTSEPEPMPF